MVFSSRPWFSVRAGFDRAPFIFIHCKSVVPDPDRAPVDAGALLQSQLDELVLLQARFARLDRTWLPYLLGDAGPDRPPLTGSLLLAPTLVDFQQCLRALAGRCGHLVRRTQRQLDRTQRTALRVGALLLQPDRSPSEERADGHR